MFGNTNLLTYDFTISVFLTQYSHYKLKENRHRKYVPVWVIDYCLSHHIRVVNKSAPC
jgi:hypothetical protein